MHMHQTVKPSIHSPYNQGMHVLFSFQLCGGDTPYLAPHELEKKHEEAKEASLAMFHGTRKMGGSEFSKEYLDRLLKEINQAFENFEKLNDGKNIFNAARTPAVFFTLVVLGYFLSSVFSSLGLVSFVRMCSLVIWSGLLAIVVWSYIRFSGEFREYGAKLDHFAELIWDEVSIFFAITVVCKAEYRTLVLCLSLILYAVKF